METARETHTGVADVRQIGKARVNARREVRSDVKTYKQLLSSARRAVRLSRCSED